MDEKKGDKIISAIGYLFVLCFVPLLWRKNSPFAQHHGKQGLVLMIAFILLWIFDFALAAIPIVGWLMMSAGWITLFVWGLMGIISALSGRLWVMPFLGKYAKEVRI